MPWKEVKTMDLKTQLINDWDHGNSSITDLSQIYGISRPTVYKWLNRYRFWGPEGLKEQSRAPKTCPNRTPQAVIDLLTEQKRKNNNRGAKKIRAKLLRENPALSLPAVSTISYWFKKEGLVQPRKKRHHVPAYTQPFSKCYAPNDVWSIDYKGQFFMRNRHLCYPFTASDNFSRYILGCKALAGPRYVPTRKYLEKIFREYGLPVAIRSDNGTPFASRSIGGISQLMIWFIQLGIIPERITKGCPQENGRHERMHKTLKADTEIGRNLRDQTEIFELFRADFNNDRPHESLNDRTPSDCYQKSLRPYVERPRLADYPADCLVRKVRYSGELRFKGQIFFLSAILAGQPVGVKQVTDNDWTVQYGFYVLGTIDLRKNKIIQKV